jgi:xylulokinase
VPVHLPSDGEFGAALGAARLAMVAVTGVNPDSVMTSPTIGETIEPEKSMLGTFDEAYHRFCSAYPLIKAAQ